MFNIQDQYFPRDKHSLKDQQPLSYQQKNMQFRQNIRKKQIQQKMKCMREEILASLSEDYSFLKDINLNDTLTKLREIKEDKLKQNWQDVDKIINNIFIYSRSDQSDHLYYLIDDQIIGKLTNMLHINHIQAFHKNPRTYIRILWVIANYTTYVSEAIDNYHQLLFSIELCKQIFFDLFLELTGIPEFYQSQRQYKIFTHVQAKQILYLALFSINNLSVNKDILLSICFKPNRQASFLNNLIQEFNKLLIFTKSNQIKNTLVSDMLSSTINIFQNILKLDISKIQTMQQIYQIDFQLANMLLQLLTVVFHSEKQSNIQLHITIALKHFLDIHLYEKQQMIVTHNFHILFQMFRVLSQQLLCINDNILNYNNMLEIEGITKESLSSLKNKSASLQKRLLQLLQIFIILFRVNIPEENSNQIYDTYINWLEQILPIFRKLFTANDPSYDEVRLKIFVILCDACLQQDFCDMIIEQLWLMNRIFYYIKSQSAQVRLKKAALNVLNSIICISLDGYSDLRAHVIEMLRNNKILQILTNYIGEYVDEELNKRLLHSLELYLNTEPVEDPEDHVIWAQFCQEGGNKKLSKYHSVIKNIEIRQIIQSILLNFKSM